MAARTAVSLSLALIAATGPASAAAPGLTPAAMADMDRACAVVTTRPQVNACVEPLYNHAMARASVIWNDLHAGGRVPVRVTDEQKLHYPGTFEQACQMHWLPELGETQTPESYLGQSRWCLAFAAGLADTNLVAYDADSVTFLLARHTRLRHLDIK